MAVLESSYVEFSSVYFPLVKLGNLLSNVATILFLESRDFYYLNSQSCWV